MIATVRPQKNLFGAAQALPLTVFLLLLFVFVDKSVFVATVT